MLAPKQTAPKRNVFDTFDAITEHCGPRAVAPPRDGGRVFLVFKGELIIRHRDNVMPSDNNLIAYCAT